MKYIRFFSSLILLILCGCTTYSSKFTCSDADGYTCIMLHSIDQKIDNNEIEI